MVSLFYGKEYIYLYFVKETAKHHH